VTSVGQRIGVGKEGDISIIRGKGTKAWIEDDHSADDLRDVEEDTRILKIHRFVLSDLSRVLP
jgi:RIO-like serine/threonine protein kinase